MPNPGRLVTGLLTGGESELVPLSEVAFLMEDIYANRLTDEVAGRLGDGHFLVRPYGFHQLGVSGPSVQGPLVVHEGRQFSVVVGAVKGNQEAGFDTLFPLLFVRFKRPHISNGAVRVSTLRGSRALAVEFRFGNGGVQQRIGIKLSHLLDPLEVLDLDQG